MKITITLTDVDGELDVDIEGTKELGAVLEIIYRAAFMVAYSIGEKHGRRNVCEND